MARLALDEIAWSSPWRRRSTVEKALLCLGLLLVAVTSPHALMSLAVLLVGLAVALGLARVPARPFLLTLLAPTSFLLIGAVVIAVHVGSAPPAAIWQWGPFSTTRDGLLLAAEVSARSVASFTALLLLASTTPMTDVLAGLRRIRVPEVLIDIAGLIYRMLFTLLDVSGAILEAQANRLGFASGKSARRSIGMLGGAVLVQAWNRARRLESGLTGRGYDGSLRTLTARRDVSVAFVAASGALLLALAASSVLIVVIR